MFTFMASSPTWVEVCEGADDKVQSGDGQHGQQYQLESDDPLHTRQVDSEQRQQHRRRHAAHRPLALHSQHLGHRLREPRDVHGSSYTLRGERRHESGDNTGKRKKVQVFSSPVRTHTGGPRCPRPGPPGRWRSWSRFLHPQCHSAHTLRSPTSLSPRRPARPRRPAASRAARLCSPGQCWGQNDICRTHVCSLFLQFSFLCFVSVSVSTM